MLDRWQAAVVYRVLRVGSTKLLANEQPIPDCSLPVSFSSLWRSTPLLQSSEAAYDVSCAWQRDTFVGRSSCHPRVLLAIWNATRPSMFRGCHGDSAPNTSLQPRNIRLYKAGYPERLKRRQCANPPGQNHR